MPRTVGAILQGGMRASELNNMSMCARLSHDQCRVALLRLSSSPVSSLNLRCSTDYRGDGRLASTSVGN
eukprot:4824161-Amphidinium_carterae.1